MKRIDKAAVTNPEQRIQFCRDWVLKQLDKEPLNNSPELYRLWRLGRTIDAWFEMDDMLLGFLWVHYLLEEPFLPGGAPVLEPDLKRQAEIYRSEYSKHVQAERVRTGSREAALLICGDGYLTLAINQLRPLIKSMILSRMGLTVPEGIDKSFYDGLQRLYQRLAATIYTAGSSFKTTFAVMQEKVNFEV